MNQIFFLQFKSFQAFRFFRQINAASTVAFHCFGLRLLPLPSIRFDRSLRILFGAVLGYTLRFADP